MYHTRSVSSEFARTPTGSHPPGGLANTWTNVVPLGPSTGYHSESITSLFYFSKTKKMNKFIALSQF